MDWSKGFSTLFNNYCELGTSNNDFWTDILTTNNSIDFPTTKIGKDTNDPQYNFIEIECCKEFNTSVNMKVGDKLYPGLSYHILLSSFLILIARYSQYETVFTVPYYMDNLKKYLTFIIENPNINIKPSNLCYMIYTSGSTGEPKGVMLNHKGRVNNFYDFNSRFSINENDKVLAVSSLSFDMCAYDIFGILAAGASIVLPELSLAAQPIHWLKLIQKRQVTIWHSVPIVLDLLYKCAKHRGNIDISSLRLALLGGDWIPITLSNKFNSINPNCEIISLGGATEVSMDSIIYPIEEVNQNWKSIPYGKPMYNQLAYILDKHQQLLPIGVPGELYLGGIGVGKGYYNRPEITSERFLPNKWSEDPQSKIYKTGDLARYFLDGNIELLGRVDFQVKINGIRIELGEIESCLKKHQDIENAVTLAIDSGNNQKKIIAFIISNDKSSRLSTVILKNFLKETLPEHFIPSDFIFLNELPLTPNGKIDRKRLQCIRKKNIEGER